MKTIATLLSLVCILATGCFSPRKNFSTTAVTVDTLMQEYADLVVAGHVGDNDQKNVRVAYATYQAAMTAYGSALLSSDTNAVKIAANSLIAARGQIVDLLTPIIQKGSK